jgi:hypothetical protein
MSACLCLFVCVFSLLSLYLLPSILSWSSSLLLLPLLFIFLSSPRPPQLISLPLLLISLTSSPLISPPSFSPPVRASAQLYQSEEGYTGAAAEGDCGRRETHLECIRYRILGRVFTAVSAADDCHSSSLPLLLPLDLSLPSYFPPLSPHLSLISVCTLPFIAPVPSIAVPHRPFHTSSSFPPPHPPPPFLILLLLSSSCRNCSH